MRAFAERILGRGSPELVRVPRDPPLASYAYTRGLHSRHGHPELLLAGLRDEQRSELLELAAELVRDGERFGPGAESWRLAQGYPARFRPVEAELAAALAPRLPPATPVLQWVWPDAAGRWPWTEGCDPAVIAAQRLR